MKLSCFHHFIAVCNLSCSKQLSEAREYFVSSYFQGHSKSQTLWKGAHLSQYTPSVCFMPARDLCCILALDCCLVWRSSRKTRPNTWEAVAAVLGASLYPCSLLTVSLCDAVPILPGTRGIPQFCVLICLGDLLAEQGLLLKQLFFSPLGKRLAGSSQLAICSSS